MIRGIKGRPYIDIDPFIDVERLKSMHVRLSLGIAQGKRFLGCYGDGVRDPNLFEMFRAQTRFLALADDDPIKIAGMPLYESDLGRWRYFLKMVWGTFSPNTSLELRAPPRRDRKAEVEGSYWTDNVKYFPELVDFIQTLPFEKLGRVIVFIHEHNCPIAIHMDRHPSFRHEKHRSEFIWMRATKDKDFFIFDDTTETKITVESHTAFFNDHDFHGGNATNKATYSIRVDGIFLQSFREQIGIGDVDSY